MLDQSAALLVPKVRKSLVILMTALAIACGRAATPTAPSPALPAATGDLKSLLLNAFDAFSIPGEARRIPPAPPSY